MKFDLHSSEIIPTRCNSCGLIFPNALLYMFRVTIPPIIRSKFAVYTANILLMVGGIVTRNMYSKAFGKIKPQLLHLVGIISLQV
jgi:hypothetical protein